MSKGASEDELAKLIVWDGLPVAERQYYFAPEVDGKPVRRWRFDFAWPAHMLALEIDGGLFGGGRHGGRPSVVRDLEKRAVAACLGWRVIPVTPSQVRSGKAIEYLRAALTGAPLPL